MCNRADFWSPHVSRYELRGSKKLTSAVLPGALHQSLNDFSETWSLANHVLCRVSTNEQRYKRRNSVAHFPPFSVTYNTSIGNMLAVDLNPSVTNQERSILYDCFKFEVNSSIRSAVIIGVLLMNAVGVLQLLNFRRNIFVQNFCVESLLCE